MSNRNSRRKHKDEKSSNNQDEIVVELCFNDKLYVRLPFPVDLGDKIESWKFNIHTGICNFLDMFIQEDIYHIFLCNRNEPGQGQDNLRRLELKDSNSWFNLITDYINQPNSSKSPRLIIDIITTYVQITDIEDDKTKLAMLVSNDMSKFFKEVHLHGSCVGSSLPTCSTLVDNILPKIIINNDGIRDHKDTSVLLCINNEPEAEKVIIKPMEPLNSILPDDVKQLTDVVVGDLLSFYEYDVFDNELSVEKRNTLHFITNLNKFCISHGCTLNNAVLLIDSYCKFINDSLIKKTPKESKNNLKTLDDIKTEIAKYEDDIHHIWANMEEDDETKTELVRNHLKQINNLNISKTRVILAKNKSGLQTDVDMVVSGHTIEEFSQIMNEFIDQFPVSADNDKYLIRCTMLNKKSSSHKNGDIQIVKLQLSVDLNRSHQCYLSICLDISLSTGHQTPVTLSSLLAVQMRQDDGKSLVVNPHHFGLFEDAKIAVTAKDLILILKNNETLWTPMVVLSDNTTGLSPHVSSVDLDSHLSSCNYDTKENKQFKRLKNSALVLVNRLNRLISKGNCDEKKLQFSTLKIGDNGLYELPCGCLMPIKDVKDSSLKPVAKISIYYKKNTQMLNINIFCNTCEKMCMIFENIPILGAGGYTLSDLIKCR